MLTRKNVLSGFRLPRSGSIVDFEFICGIFLALDAEITLNYSSGPILFLSSVEYVASDTSFLNF